MAQAMITRIARTSNELIRNWIKPAKQGRKQPVCTNYSIQYNFEHFNIDNNKTCIDKEMQQCHQRITKHFLLAKCQQQNIFPSHIWVVVEILLSSQVNVSADLPYFPAKSQIATALKNMNKICCAICIAINYKC